jgi:hypothetical protein
MVVYFEPTFTYITCVFVFYILYHKVNETSDTSIFIMWFSQSLHVMVSSFGQGLQSTPLK